ncbi:MAG TPA: YggS family pyridoxal phosphate-dependent enzyme [Bacteroidota bacterium]|nr:YggS family pyridoxal phosphate-dependent enzyme [Bacteroidota bacterium]
MITENIKNLQENIVEICKRCNRNPQDIQIVAVSKTWDSSAIREAWKAGITNFGENYVQEFRTKYQELKDIPLQWHFVGHLQSNKVKFIIDAMHLIHTVDDIELGKEINKRAEKLGKVQDALIEVHATNEPTKYGVKPEQTASLVKELAMLDNIRVLGLMTMGPLADDPEASRSSFRILRQLQTEIRSLGIEHISMEHLSMGMSFDYPIAIEEGATLLRIGTAIFGERIQPQS